MIRRAKLTDLPVLTELALELWPDHSADKMYFDLGKIMTSGESVFFLAYEAETAVGFAQCQLRHDYVEGTETSPVGYLEGLYVQAASRKQGFAGQLMKACEAWAKAEGCIEFASDCEIDNEESLAFHLKLGFKEANRIICFKKTL
jgi:aminoglycoside 6'-N-acetyltransferase I